MKILILTLITYHLAASLAGGVMISSAGKSELLSFNLGQTKFLLRLYGQC